MRPIQFPARRCWSPAAIVSAVVAAAACSAPPAVADATGSAGPAHPATSARTLWTSRYAGTGTGASLPSAIGVGPGGKTVYVTGSSHGSRNTDDFATVAYSAATGAQRWAARYRGPGERIGQATALAVGPAGRTVYVTGHTGTPGSDYATVAYAAGTGRQIWARRYAGPQAGGTNQAISIGVSPDGRTVYVTGTSNGGYVTIAYNASTGAERWLRRFSGGFAAAYGLAVSKNGALVVVTGQATIKGVHSYATVAYDAASGKQLWFASYQPPDHGTGFPAGVVIAPDDQRVFVTGRFVGRSNAGFQFATVAYSAASGKQLWASGYDRHDNAFDWATALAVAPDSATVYVTGFVTESATKQNYATVAYSAATGTQRWARRYNGTANRDDDASAITVSPDGRSVYVTGHSDTKSVRASFATIGYAAATGAQLWVKRLARAGVAEAIAAGPGGHAIYVTGGRDVLRPGTTNPYVTVGYRV